ncbi:unnamed protein product [Adineta steineri]|uniref:Uncharacterized protein n=1 Tax=Adineta steineri TaxID=433720 RepID=A0A813MZ32_9BILA|nr:unnamed protein product [Adineta steineri]
MYSSGALEEANKYPVGTWHDCWYDTKRSYVTQLTKPSTRLATSLLTSAGLLVLFSSICLYYMCVLIRKQSRQPKQNSPHVHVIFLK